MANSNYENKIIDAIETIVDNKVKNAGYNSTLKATIITCIDPTIGKYKVRYQDSTWFAYSIGTDTKYNAGTEVYILVANNDMANDKTILGTVERLGENYSATPEQENYYEIVGNNCIESAEMFELCSYIENGIITLYDKSKNINKIKLNITSVNDYIKESSSILCGGRFKTTFPLEQQFRGNYGIVFELVFKDNATGAHVARQYQLDVNLMLGNPYKFSKFTRQYYIFDIDKDNFEYVNKIYFFENNFPNIKSGKPADIFVQELELFGCNELDTVNGCLLTILTPNGAYFNDENSDEETKLLQAQIKVKGENIDPETQTDIEYYWFRENVLITTSSEKYCSFGGQGWECLNNFNYINTDSEGTAVVEWVPDKYQKQIAKKDILAKEVRYKCVAIYNDTILSREVLLINYSSKFDISIWSNYGSQFYYDSGNPNLTCLVNDVSYKDNDKYYFAWSKIDSYNNFYSLPETTDYNKEYNDAVAGYIALKEQVKDEIKMPAASQYQLNQYLTTMEKYDIIQRVERNSIFSLEVNKITGFSTFKCSVFYDGIFIGTASIVIYNSLEGANYYTLILNNATQVFKYNETGVAPTNGSVNNGLTLEPLDFDIYDSLGNQLSDEILSKCDIKWTIPIENTLLTLPEGYEDYVQYDYDNGVAIFNNFLSIVYGITNKYDVVKSNNDIKLEVVYKGNVLKAKTNFTFTKDGEPGTNGTEFVCKIVPNTDEIMTERPIILNGQPNFKLTNANKWFRIQMWHNGTKIYESTQGGTTDENKPIEVEWEVLKNKYTTSISDNSSITINYPDKIANPNNFNFKYNGYNKNTSPANIIKAIITYNSIKYYATFPLITASTTSNYKVNLKEHSGFDFAIYSADGRHPEYDNNNPFELIVKKNINNYWEDVSQMEKAQAINYSWTIQGKIYDPVEKVWKKQIFLQDDSKTRETLERNQVAYKPVDGFNGECLNVGLECTMTNNGIQIGTIHIPVHLLLNRYGQAALNGWDGNSISIKDDLGVILAPQIGAGKKENDNSFTGMLMGEVKEAGQNSSDVGLIGYHRGERTLHLSAYDGYSIFGKFGPGQLILDPTSDHAMIYSNNFWDKYHSDTTNSNRNGLPITNYSYDGDTYDESTGVLIKKGKYKYDGQANQSNKDMQSDTDSGMIIDLTAPRILFGNGNLRVEPNGYLYARGGGQIAGWKINDYRIDSTDNGVEPKATGSTGMSSVYEEHTDGVTEWDVYYPEGSINKPIAFWAGGTNIDGKFHVAHDGYVRMTEATIGSGDANNLIYIGNENGNSSIFNFTKQQFNADADGFYIGTNGISLGHTFDYNNETIPNLATELSGTFSKWAVTPEGRMYAQDAIISGTLYSGEGQIAGWNIDKYKIYKGRTGLSSVDKDVEGATKVEIRIPGDNAWISDNKIAAFWAGNYDFFVSHDGYLKVEQATIGSGSDDEKIAIAKSYIGDYSAIYSGLKNHIDATAAGFYIGTDGIALGENNNFKVTSEGNMSGQNWYINNTGDAKFGSLYVEASGNIYASGGNDANKTWSINADGEATFNHLIANNGGSIAGWQISSNKLSKVNNNNQSIGMSSSSWPGDPVFWAGGGDPWNTSDWTTSIPFYVTNDGKLKASNANIVGDIIANSGKIGNWTINTDGGISNGNVILGKDGDITATSGKIGEWEIGPNDLHSSNVYLRSNNGDTVRAIEVNGGTFYVQNNGYMKASSGNIAGWNILPSSIKKGSTSFSASGTNGKLSTAGWEITENYIKSKDNDTYISSDGGIMLKSPDNKTNFTIMSDIVTSYSEGTTILSSATLAQLSSNGDAELRGNGNAIVRGQKINIFGGDIYVSQAWNRGDTTGEKAINGTLKFQYDDGWGLGTSNITLRFINGICVEAKSSDSNATNP